MHRPPYHHSLDIVCHSKTAIAFVQRTIAAEPMSRFSTASVTRRARQTRQIVYRLQGG
jgi:hypothetical protein